ncbi:hypothetical protein ELG72_06395 [Rhizobium leguminosarum]|nr:hypothetical protein [Rhizobium leguminosarum bv. viciae]TBF81698.1 hypothetical protein ELG86_05975 [Rhizobium leguminosarum]TBF98288.1 hypothetical protein ELG85_05950 [Rhizobium leguminosarum]TBG03237.1 hypothetical protein ELG82_06700 [Rhizobium leguminosarum]TBG20064.1 hypothetical protein ELG81_05690 [Rhizobium leguminosarum]
MLAYGFQLVNAERREMNILGVNGSNREISERWRAIRTRTDGDSVILSYCLRFFRQSGFSFATMGDVTCCVPESNASPRSG